MYYYGKRSKARKDTCHPKLQLILDELIKIMDVTIIYGYRGESDQNQAFKLGASTLKFPESKHNRMPSIAFDVAPYNSDVPGGIDWSDTVKFYYMQGLIKGIAASHGIKIRQGHDWDGDNDFKDQTLNDLVHTEYIEG